MRTKWTITDQFNRTFNHDNFVIAMATIPTARSSVVVSTRELPCPDDARLRRIDVTCSDGVVVRFTWDTSTKRWVNWRAV